MEGGRTDLYLCLDAGAHPAPGELDALIAAASPAALLLTGAAGAPRQGVQALVQSAKRQNLAVLIADDIALAAELGADGVHIAADQRRLAEARARLGPERTIGASCGLSRHEAMVMGEGGADYIAFGERGRQTPDGQGLAELIAWWSAIFELPSVAWLGGGAPLEEARELVAAGADFIAVRWGTDDGVKDFEQLGGIAAVLKG